MKEKIIDGVKVHEWKYQNLDGKDDTGYKDLNESILSTYNCQNFSELNEEEQKQQIDEILKIIRDRNIYTNVYYYSHQDIIDEIRACKEKELPPFNGEILDKRPTLGSLLLKFLFPNFHLVDCKGIKDNSLYARFIDDHKLWRTIEYCLKFKPKVKTPVTSRNIADGMNMIGGNVATSYLPMKVKMLLEYYMPNGGNYFDFSCGFGGRLLGAMSVTNGNINYYGFEPNSETFYHLNKFKGYIEEALGNKNQIHLYKKGSEEQDIPKELIGNIDFAFSCPPYFNLEKYSDEETQCYIKYPTLKEWLDGYVTSTIKNLYKVLKSNAYYAVNISDFKVNNKNVNFVEDWINISENNGFELIKVIITKTGKQRPNSTSIKNTYESKDECIYLFKKI